MANGVKYSQEHKEQARQENSCLVTLQLTNRGGKGGITFAGAVSNDEAKSIDGFIAGLIRNRTIADVQNRRRSISTDGDSISEFAIKQFKKFGLIPEPPENVLIKENNSEPKGK